MGACEGGGFWLHAAGVDVEEFEGAPLQRGLLGQLLFGRHLAWRVVINPSGPVNCSGP